MSETLTTKLLFTWPRRYGLLVASHLIGISGFLFIISTMNAGKISTMNIASFVLLIVFQLVGHFAALRLQKSLLSYIPAELDETP
jgi:hypothetical protein